jgi:DNA adenine methylase
MRDLETNFDLCHGVLAMTPPTVERWRMWKEAKPVALLDKALRTLFLNRTSFSGILDANPIGGINQTGPHKIGARWNHNALCAQIEACYHKLAGIRITSGDFEPVVAAPGRNVFMYLDPPYYHKGNLLYQSKMTPADHARLAALLKQTPHRFLLTYDDCPEVRVLYTGAHMYERSWFYSAADNPGRKQGNELFISNFPIVETALTQPGFAI